ncbi:hypothetical protein G7Y89_g4250 [Cudoniella acicularis]|uniref:Aminotransferase class I/classII large domain-containing protein n=1 Tax=Cudoniella acicularis TaxID=354080 RepID=A0A8H4W6W5_9HELO|nr:hypothetical protein G7Y89_g4250 [Cudoniella acicularis]
MLSRRCRQKNEVTVPKIFSQWNALPSGKDVVDMSSGENWMMRDEILEAFTAPGTLDSLGEKSFSYPEGIGGPIETRTALAHLLNNRFNPGNLVLPSQIVLTAGGCEALDALIEQICDPGDGVLVATPYWTGLDISISVQNEAYIAPVHIPRDLMTNPRCVDYYTHTLRSVNSTHPVKALLLCNPTNPTGECHSLELLQALLDFCEQEEIHFISDEVYALSVHGGSSSPLTPPGTPQLPNHSPQATTFVSALSLNTASPNLHVIYSLSKDFGCNGIRLGALITQSSPSILLATALNIGPQVSSITSHLATTTILNPSFYSNFLETSVSRLRGAYLYTSAFLTKHGIDFVPATAGIFVLANLGENGTREGEVEVMEELKRERVKVIPAGAWGGIEGGWCRIVFAVKEKDLAEGLERIGRAVEARRRQVKATIKGREGSLADGVVLNEEDSVQNYGKRKRKWGMKKEIVREIEPQSLR